jgi:hypothetical protein
MTIEIFIEIPSDSASTDRVGKGELLRRFTVKTLHTLAPVADAQAMLDLCLRLRPDLKPFRMHPTRRDALVTTPRVERQSKWLWDLQVPYSTEVDRDEFEHKELEGKKPDPRDNRAKVSISTKPETVIITKDINGKVLANTAGDPFPDIEDEDYLLEVSVSKNVSSIESDWLLKYPGSVNEEEMKYLGVRFPPKTLLLTELFIGDLATDSVGGKTIEYYPLSYRMTYREKGWLKEKLNMGLRERRTDGVAAGGEQRLEAIATAKGDHVDDVVFLDIYGMAYRVGVAASLGRTANDYKQPLRANLTDKERITLEFEVKRVLPFKKLPHK